MERGGALGEDTNEGWGPKRAVKEGCGAQTSLVLRRADIPPMRAGAGACTEAGGGYRNLEQQAKQAPSPHPLLLAVHD